MKESSEQPIHQEGDVSFSPQPERLRLVEVLRSVLARFRLLNQEARQILGTAPLDENLRKRLKVEDMSDEARTAIEKDAPFEIAVLATPSGEKEGAEIEYVINLLNQESKSAQCGLATPPIWSH